MSSTSASIPKQSKSSSTTGASVENAVEKANVMLAEAGMSTASTTGGGQLMMMFQYLLSTYKVHKASLSHDDQMAKKVETQLQEVAQFLEVIRTSNFPDGYAPFEDTMNALIDLVELIVKWGAFSDEKKKDSISLGDGVSRSTEYSTRFTTQLELLEKLADRLVSNSVVPLETLESFKEDDSKKAISVTTSELKECSQASPQASPGSHIQDSKRDQALREVSLADTSQDVDFATSETQKEAGALPPQPPSAHSSKDASPVQSDVKDGASATSETQKEAGALPPQPPSVHSSKDVSPVQSDVKDGASATSETKDKKDGFSEFDLPPQPPTMKKEISLCPSESDDDESVGSHDMNAKYSERPIDVTVLSAIVEKGKTDIKNLKGKDVVLVLGKTGVGKTMFIHMINGAEVYRDTTTGASQTIYRAREHDRSLQDFEIGYRQKSETKMIRSYVHSNGLVFCDMPGYKDTDSYHIDIATAVWINDVAKASKTLRLVVMIHGATLEEDKGDLFRDLMNLLTKLMKGHPEKVGFMVMFTHMSDQSDHEKDEGKLLEYIEKKISSISKAKNHEKNFLMKLLRTYIKKKTGHVRVLNPVSSNAQEIVDFISQTVHPMVDSESYVQCSLSREVELAVSFAMERLETDIKEAVCSSDVSKQANLLDLLRLHIEFTLMLKSEKCRVSLRKVMEEAIDEYEQCKISVMKVVEWSATQSETTGSTRLATLGKEEVELIVPKFSKLKLLHQVLQEVSESDIDDVDVDVEKVAPDDIVNIQLEYQRKCFLLKVNALGNMKVCLDYSVVFEQIQNVLVLADLAEIMGELYEGQISNIVTNIPEIAQQYVDMIKSRVIPVMLSQQKTCEITRQDFFGACSQAVQNLNAETYCFFYQVCFDCMVTKFTGDAILIDSSVDVKKTVSDHLDKIYPYLKAFVLDEVSSTMRLSYQDLLVRLKDHVATVQASLFTAVTESNMLSQNDMAVFFENVRRLQSYQLVESDFVSGSPTDKPTVESDLLVALDTTFAEYLKREFISLKTLLFQSEHNASFALLANKAQLFRYNPSAELLFPKTWACLSALKNDIKETANKKLDDIKIIDIEHNPSECKVLLKQLDTGIVQLADLLLHYDSIGRVRYDIYKNMRNLIEDWSKAVLNRLRSPSFSPTSDFSHLLPTNTADSDPKSDLVLAELSGCFRELKVVDTFGYYNRKWDGQLSFLDESILAPHLKSILDTIHAKQAESAGHVIHIDNDILEKLKCLFACRWFDGISQNESLATLSITNVVDIGMEGCLWRFDSLKEEFLRTLASEQFNHNSIQQNLEEFKDLKVLFALFNIPFDISSILNKFVLRVQKYGDSICAECNQIGDLAQCAEKFPYAVVDEFMKRRPFYESIAAQFKVEEEMKVLSTTEKTVTQKLNSLIAEPLVQNRKQKKPVLSMDATLLLSIFQCQEKMKSQAVSLLPSVSVLEDFDGKNKSLRIVLKQDVSDLMAEIEKLISAAVDFEQLEEKIALLDKFIPLQDYVDEPILKRHTFCFGQFVSLQSHVQAELKEKVNKFDFTGIRKHLDLWKDNEPSFESYNNLMNLIGTKVKQYISALRKDEKDGATVAEGFDRLNNIWVEIGGNEKKFDHLKEHCGVDIESEIAELRQRMNAYIDSQMKTLQNYEGHHLESAVKTADLLWVYVKHVQSSSLEADLIEFTDKKLGGYLCWDGVTEPAKNSLAFQLVSLVYAISSLQSFDDSKDAVSVATLTNILDQLSYLQGVTQNQRLKKCIDYSFWTRQVLSQFNEMFDQIAAAAEKSGTFATNLDILKLAATYFSESFMRHMGGNGFNMDKRIRDMEKGLETYNNSKSSVFESPERCAVLKRRLDILFKEQGTYSSYVSQFTTFKFSYHKPARNEYKEKVKLYEGLADQLYVDLIRALEDNNHKLVQSIISSLQTADSVLYFHLYIPLYKVDKLVVQHFKHLFSGLQAALEKKDLRMFEQLFEGFYSYRKLLSNNHLVTDKDSIAQTSEMHQSLAILIDDCRVQFEKMCAEFNFDNALNLVDLLKVIRHFIDSSNTQDYCKSFSEVSYTTGSNVTKGAKAATRSKYIRVISKSVDKDLLTLSVAMSNFPQLSQIKTMVMDLHSAIIAKVKESVDNHEYFKLRSISEGLRSFHLLSDLGGGKELIDDTKKSVQDIIKGSLDALRQDVTQHWSDKNWSKLNDAIQMLLDAEQELKHFSGLIDNSLLYNIQQDLEKRLSDIGSQAISIATDTAGDQNERIRDFSFKLSDLGRVYDQVQAYHVIAKIQIQRVLNHCREQCGLYFIFRLGVVLEEGTVFEEDPDSEASIRIGRRLVMDFHHFKDVNTMSWNKRVAQMPVKECLGNMKCYTYDAAIKKKKDYPIEQTKLESMFEQYNVAYSRCVTEYLPSGKDQTEIVTSVLKRAASMQPCTLRNWDDSKKQEIPEILAGIFAYYTVSKCGDSFNSIGQGEGEGEEEEGPPINAADILITPHNIQVLTILRLLGCDDSPKSLNNHLMQIGTGEGKSVILGALATIFGILNFSVRCVCYSEYLSSRDYGDFKDIFVAFHCDNRVTYSKITAFSEASVAKQGDIRELTKKMIMNKSGGASTSDTMPSSTSSATSDTMPSSTSSAISDTMPSSTSSATSDTMPSSTSTSDTIPDSNNHGGEEILLVDEVDVFFGKDFYGQTYNQVTSISLPEITALIKKIWKDRSTKPRLSSLSQCPEYTKLISDYPQWQYLIDNELKLMCCQVNSFDQPVYEYNAEIDCIGYSDHDTISYSLSYGYRTLFAYMRELDRGNVKSIHMAQFEDKHLRMQISCGQFSYANIKPACILGVSGTLEALTDYEQDVMARYNIQKYSIAPSVYGTKDFNFDAPDTGISIEVDKANYFKAIVNAINDISLTKDGAKKKHRAVIVFFESFERLEEFRKSEFYRQVIENPNRLSENTPKDSRDYIIKKAATVGQVTLSTKVFGRGTDFISRDNQLNDRGGTHIVQTFLSEMLSEEIQVQGRTSRQGQKGSYSLVLLLEDELIKGKGKTMVPRSDTLAHFGIDPTEMSNQSRANRYSYLDKKRAEKREADSIEIEDNLAVATERDKMTRSYFSALLKHDMNQSATLFKEVYQAFKGQAGMQAVGLHVVFMLDESGSMSGASFSELIRAFDAFVAQRSQKDGTEQDVMTVIMFDNDARVIASMVPFSSPPSLSFQGGGTAFNPALRQAEHALRQSADADLTPILILMTDGGCGDLAQAVETMSSIDAAFNESNLQSHFVAFGQGANMGSLEALRNVCTDGHIHTAEMGDLADTFKDIEDSLIVPEYN